MSALVDQAGKETLYICIYTYKQSDNYIMRLILF